MLKAKDQAKKKKPLHEYPEKKIATRLFTHIGMDSMRLHSLHALDDNILLSFAANTVQFVNVNTGAITCTPGPEGGGIGAVCVHPSRQFYTVCEKHPNGPNAYVYEYPSKKVRATLKRGAERGYTACRFSDSGAMLATVAMEPDYVLTIWNWESGAIILRNKAFGADVFNVCFNRFNDGLMVTSGSGHVKFWSMANTFTGLKLQGAIGKFGRTEISDVTAFVSLPDGKVISGSESGSLLLWEGNLIKCELGRAQPDNEEQPVAKCHAGNIFVVEMIEQNRILLTSGDDGYMRYWSIEQIDAAENSGTDQATAIKMIAETYLGDGVRVRCITRSVDGQLWYYLDSAGAIRKTKYMTYDAITHAAEAPQAAAEAQRPPLLRFNSGGVTAVAASPFDHTCMTAGEDATIRQLDYIGRAEEFCVRFDAGVMDLRYLALPGDREKRHLVATFKDGTIRVLRRARNTVEVVSQQRPHESPIVSWAVDAQGKQLWTLAADKSAFYFRLSSKVELEPVGFCTLPLEPRCCEFSASGDALFVGFKTGSIIALEAPEASAINHEAGYEFAAVWSGIGYRQKMKPPEKEKKPTVDGMPPDDDDDDDDDLMDEDEDRGPWAVNFIQRLPTGTVLVGLEAPELCYEYNLTTRYPSNAMGPPPLPPTGIEPAGWVEEPLRNQAFRDTIVRGATVSSSGATLLLRTEHSTVIRRAIKNLAACTFATQLHDSQAHSITSCGMAFDERVLITAGLDGMMFTHELEGVEPPTVAEIASPEALPVAPMPTIAAIPNGIQHQKELDDKHKAEEAALGKKELLMRKVRAVLVEFDKLLDENEAAVGGKKVPRDELILDPEVLELLETKKQSAVAEAHKEYEWQSAKKQTLMQKLKAAFVDPLEWERFVVHGFANGLTVSAFRTPLLTESQQRVLEHVRSIHQAGFVSPTASPGTTTASPLGSPAGSPAQVAASPPGAALSVDGRSPTQAGEPLPDSYTDPDEAGIGGTIGGKTLGGTATKAVTSTSVKSQLEKAEERRRERLERARGMEELRARDPSLQPDNVAEQAEIERAAEEMGDYRLKTSKDYSRRSAQHAPTAPRKVAQLIVLEDGINTLRREFNAKVLALRDEKARLCEAVNKDRARIQAICEELKEPYDSQPFALKPEEQPEKRLEIDHAGLEKFAEEREKQRKRQEALERAKKGFGSDLATMEEDEDESHANKRRQSVPTAPQPGGAPGAAWSPREKFEMDLKLRIDALQRSELEDEEWAMRRTQLEYERSCLERKITETVRAFDESLAELHHEKLKLEADLCMADMRVKLLFREYLLLLDFTQKDKDITLRKEKRLVEVRENEAKKRLLDSQIETKQADIADADRIIASLKEDVDELLSDVSNKGLQQALEDIYKKKIKRRQPDDDDDDDDDDSSSDDDDDESEEDWAEEGDDQLPDGCDEELFQRVLAIRSKRLDQNDRKMELTKSIEGLSRDRSNAASKLDTATRELRKVEKEEDEFKHLKQERLNELETMVVLKLSQIKCLDENNKLPPEFTNDYIVFTQDGLEKLARRIDDLDREKQELEGTKRQLQQDATKVDRRLRKKQSEYQELAAKVHEIMLLKFGQTVNLEKLENVAVDRQTEELKVALKAEEIRWERELAKQNERLQQLKLVQQQRIAENTACLKDLGSYRAEQRDLEEALRTSAGKIVAKMTGGSKVATAADRAHLKDLVVAQQQEIDALKNEIAMLRRKGGHVYTPVVNKVSPPPPPASA